MLGWEGCVKTKRHGIPCDIGGGFPLHEIRDKHYGGIQATMQIILNSVANDNKGRFQICGEVNEQLAVIEPKCSCVTRLSR